LTNQHQGPELPIL